MAARSPYTVPRAGLGSTSDAMATLSVSPAAPCAPSPGPEQEASASTTQPLIPRQSNRFRDRSRILIPSETNPSCNFTKILRLPSLGRCVTPAARAGERPVAARRHDPWEPVTAATSTVGRLTTHTKGQSTIDATANIVMLGDGRVRFSRGAHHGGIVHEKCLLPIKDDAAPTPYAMREDRGGFVVSAFCSCVCQCTSVAAEVEKDWR